MKKETPHLNHKFYWNLSYTGMILFFLLRIPITNIIGNEGNGFFAVSLEFYAFFCLFFGQASTTVTSRMVKECMGKQQYRNSKKTFTSLLLIYGSFSVACALLLGFLSDYVLQLFNMKLSGISFRLLCVFFVLHTLLGVFRGYFEGCGTRMPTCFSKIIEALIAGTSGIFLSILLTDYGTKVGNLLFDSRFKSAFGAVGVAAGCICGGVFAFLFLLLINQMYQVSLKQLIHRDANNYRYTLKSVFIKLLKEVWVVLLELLFFHLYRITDILLYLKTAASETSQANYVAILGAYYGKVFLIVGIFAYLILSFTGKNTKRIQKNYARNKLNHCLKFLLDDIKQIVIMAAVSCTFLFVLAPNLLKLLFHSATELEVNLFRVGIFMILFMTVGRYLYEILDALNKRVMIMVLPFISYVVQTMVMMVVIRNEGYAALALPVAECVFWFTLVLLEGIVIYKNFRLPTQKQG